MHDFWEVLRFTLSAVISAFAILALMLFMFFSSPTGEYFVRGDTGERTSQVVEHVEWANDRVLFRGSTDQAWRIYDYLIKSKPEATPEPLLKNANIWG